MTLGTTEEAVQQERERIIRIVRSITFGSQVSDEYRCGGRDTMKIIETEIQNLSDQEMASGGQSDMKEISGITVQVESLIQALQDIRDWSDGDEYPTEIARRALAGVVPSREGAPTPRVRVRDLLAAWESQDPQERQESFRALQEAGMIPSNPTQETTTGDEAVKAVREESDRLADLATEVVAWYTKSGNDVPVILASKHPLEQLRAALATRKKCHS